jgi:hypothetical protein
MAHSIGLYYPFIHFKDPNWLLLSTLYWDKMARIVPPTYDQERGSTAILRRDDELTRELATELDYVVNVGPAEVTAPVSHMFAQVLVDHAERLGERYDVSRRHEWPPDPITVQFAAQRDPQLAYVSSSKLDESLLQQLEENGLAMSHFDGQERWAGLHPRLANVYMAALAEEVATVNHLRPVTDETLDHVMTAGWSVARLSAALLDDPGLHDYAADAEDWVSAEQETSLAFLSVQAVIPKDASTLSVKKAKRIREDFGPELYRFREYVEQLVTDLPKLDPRADPRAVEAHLQVEHDMKIAPLLGELRKALRGYGVDTTLTAIGTNVAMPPVAASIPLDNPIALGTAAAFSVTPILRSRHRQAQSQFEQSEVAFLYHLESELSPRTLLQRVGNRLHRFLYGF